MTLNEEEKSSILDFFLLQANIKHIASQKKAVEIRVLAIIL
jgi:hypothetical protein